MRKVIFNFLLVTVFISLGVFVSVIAMPCDRGRVLVVNASEIIQPDLRLYGDSENRALLWSGSLRAGGVEEIILQRRYGENLLLEGKNAATGQTFSELSRYVVSVTPYGTHIYLIGPYGIRTISYGNHEPVDKESTSLIFDMLRVGLREAFFATRCVDEDLWS